MHRPRQRLRLPPRKLHPPSRPIYRVGLTGGIGSGKSEVARFLSEFGALIIDADESARVVVARGSEGLAEIAARWPKVITALGDLDRAALAKIVFDDPAAREALNAIVHPRVRALGREIEAKAGEQRIVVHVIPLLFESGFDKQCAATVVVVAPLEARMARVIARDGARRDDIRKRMAAQIDPQEAMRRATMVIHNDGNVADLRRATRVTYERLCEQDSAG